MAKSSREVKKERAAKAAEKAAARQEKKSRDKRKIKREENRKAAKERKAKVANSGGGRSGKVAKKKAFGAGSTKAERNQRRLATPKSDVKVTKTGKTKPAAKTGSSKATAKAAAKVGSRVASRAIPLVGAALTIKDVAAYAKENRKNIDESNARQRPKADKSLKQVKSSTGKKSGARQMYEKKMADRKLSRATVKSEKARREAAALTIPKKKATSESQKPTKKPTPKKAESQLTMQSKSSGPTTRKARSDSKKRQLDKKLPAAANLRKKFNELNAYKGTFKDFKREYFKKRGYKA